MIPKVMKKISYINLSTDTIENKLYISVLKLIITISKTIEYQHQTI